MLCTHKRGPKYKMQTVCTFQMNWVMRSNNKISLCCGDSEMAIIQQCSHFRQRTFSYIMHPNHCIFPPFWATMHISSSQWNIKHSYDLIFSSEGDFSLYIFFTSLVCLPSGTKLPGMSLFGVFVYWRDVWLVNAGVMIDEATNQFKRLSRLRGHWSVRGLGAERQVGLIPTDLIEIRGAQTARLLFLPLNSNFKCQLLLRWRDWWEDERGVGAGIQKQRSVFHPSNLYKTIKTWHLIVL